MLRFSVLPAVLIVSLLILTTTQVCPKDLISREDLIEDARQLAATIEEVHPDPYINGGGKIAFHRRLRHMLTSISDGGMTVEDFYELICPFVTSIGDAHTWLNSPDEFDYGLPLVLSAVGSSFYVSIVPDEASRDLMGALLLDIEGVPVEELISRAGRYVSGENDYQRIRNLTGTGMLFNRWWIERLLPEWQGGDRIAATLRLADGRTVTRSLNRNAPWESGSAIGFDSEIVQPSTEKCDFAYSFLDSAGTSALLVINDMMTYREAFEMWASHGYTDNDKQAAEIYRRYHDEDPPRDRASLIAGLPSATELFRSLTTEMKAAKTMNLFVDLRRNGGGNSAMSELLVYFLYGKEKLLTLKGKNVEIRRLSDTYFARNDNFTLEVLNTDRQVPLTRGDYDFRYDFANNGEATPESVLRMIEEFAATMPTFSEEYNSEAYSGHYLPENVVVLCSPQTFSSGFTLMYYLHQAGALITGTPSAQAGNCFGDVMGFDLEHSRLHFTVSHKYFELFPGDDETGRLLMPDYPITYQILASYDFDSNAEILYMLDILE